MYNVWDVWYNDYDKHIYEYYVYDNEIYSKT